MPPTYIHLCDHSCDGEPRVPGVWREILRIVRRWVQKTHRGARTTEAYCPLEGILSAAKSLRKTLRKNTAFFFEWCFFWGDKKYKKKRDSKRKIGFFLGYYFSSGHLSEHSEHRQGLSELEPPTHESNKFRITKSVIRRSSSILNFQLSSFSNGNILFNSRSNSWWML